MSKRKSNQVFELTCDGGEVIIVVARHVKGALSIAAYKGYTITRECVREVNASRRIEAINTAMKIGDD